ncbi:MAG: hypothetical protein ACI31F_06885 [Muribaculaceae bacterium]
MKIKLTDIDVALCIIRNISKSEEGDGKLIIDLFNSCRVTIDYNGEGLKSRKISIDSSHATKDWIGGEISVDEIESYLKK